MNPAFAAFRARVDAGELIDVTALLAAPDGWLKRACLVYLARQDREVASDAELELIARALGGKLATYIAGILLMRRVRRDPSDAAARRDAANFAQAWLAKRL
ncbi:MAG TPA: hypothetical protein VH143_14420 [Kofleriaceae bacterium]|nr:hypothetical protein [Kofleriaceae bacterium]